MTVVLWHIEISHFNEKARWALDYKGIPHELRTPTPGLHRLTALRLTRGKHDRLPVMELEGRRIGDSTAIIAALEDYKPEPALYPADPADRQRTLALEDYFDEELAARVRRLLFTYAFKDPEATVEAALPQAAGTARRTLMRALLPIARPIVRRDYDANEAASADAREGIVAAMDRLEGELGASGYLVGDEFSVADLTAAALFTPLLAPKERPYALPLPAALAGFREELEARPGGEWVTEIYARHRSEQLIAA